MTKEEVWDKHQKLVYWMDKRLTAKHGFPTTHFLGLLTECLYRCAEKYEESRGKFSTYYYWAATNIIIRNMKHETDLSFINNFNYRKKKEKHIRLNRISESIEKKYMFTDKPKEKKHWIYDDLLQSFGTWENLIALLKQWVELDKDFEALWEYQKGRTLQDIGNQYGVSKERIRQRKKRALEKIQNRFRRMEEFQELFQEKVS